MTFALWEVLLLSGSPLVAALVLAHLQERGE